MNKTTFATVQPRVEKLGLTLERTKGPQHFGHDEPQQVRIDSFALTRITTNGVLEWTHYPNGDPIQRSRSREGLDTAFVYPDGAVTLTFRRRTHAQRLSKEEALALLRVLQASGICE